MGGAYKQVKAYGSIAEQLDSQLSATIQSNREFLKMIAQVAILCARQNMALRGHDDQDTSLNKGNFLKILDLLATHSDEFKDRLPTSPRNCKYTSNTTQHILLAASDALLGQISAEAQQTGIFAIMVDECRDVSRIEQLSVCIRYVNNGVVTERFLGFPDMHELDASAITDELLPCLASKE